MPLIYIDESGDLGLDFSKKGTSNFFVVTFLFTENIKPIEKIIKNVHSRLRNNLKSKINILHSNKEKPVTRKRVLKQLARIDCKIMTIYLNKKNISGKIKKDKSVLYNYVTNILLDTIYTKKIIKIPGEIILTASKRETNKYLNTNFRKYLKEKIEDKHNIKIVVDIKTPAEEKILQAVDFISWAIYRKYEKNDPSYYEIIKNKIIEEKSFLP